MGSVSVPRVWAMSGGFPSSSLHLFLLLVPGEKSLHAVTLSGRICKTDSIACMTQAVPWFAMLLEFGSIHKLP